MTTRASLLDMFRHDIRGGLRQLRLNPGFAAAAILSLALGIAANTSIFTLVDQVLLRLLPVQDPRALVQLHMEGGRFGSQNGDGRHTFSYPIYLAFRDRGTVLAGLTGQYPDRVSLVSGDRADLADVSWAAANLFTVLGVRPHLGRVLTAGDDVGESGNPVAVLQYDFWRTRYEGRSDVVGSTIHLNGAPFTVVGVAAPDFTGTNAGVITQLWAPVTARTALDPGWPESLKNERYAWFYLTGRMKDGMTIDRAQTAMRLLHEQRKQEEVAGEFFAKFPDTKERFLRQQLDLMPADKGLSQLRRNFERPLVLLQWLVGAVLLMACTNVAGLLLARAAAREREIAIRTSLGAGRAPIVRQLFLESLVLATAGGAGGLLLSLWLTRTLVRFLPIDRASLSLSTTPDARVLAFTMAVTLATAVIFGLLPAFRGSRVPASAVLKASTGSIAGGGHVTLRKTFVGLQVALSLILLIGAGLFVRTLGNLRNVDLGFRSENVAMFGVRPATRYDEARRFQMVRSVVEGIAAVPGVAAAGANTSRLLTGGRWDSQITIPGVEPRNGEIPWSFFNAVTPGYFQVLGIPIVMGRDFTWSDWGSGRKLALINESLVKDYFGGAHPVGRQMGQGRATPPDTEIIGVFGDARYHDVRSQVPRQTFLNIDSRPVGAINVYARIAGDSRLVLPQLRAAIQRIDANLVVFDMRMLDDQLDRLLANERLLSFLSSGFAVLATLLAVVGLHGVLAFVVARRTREIGLRVALGAGRGSVVRLVLREMFTVVLIGLAAGGVAAWLAGSYVQALLFGVNAADWPVFAVSVGTLAAAALAGALAPAWRAARLSPILALRSE
jgi:predicted permease